MKVHHLFLENSVLVGEEVIVEMAGLDAPTKHASAALDCWAGPYTVSYCCDILSNPRGSEDCWTWPFTFERCCPESVHPSSVAARQAAHLLEWKQWMAGRPVESIAGLPIQELDACLSADAMCSVI